jgi:hypothetical protein
MYTEGICVSVDTYGRLMAGNTVTLPPLQAGLLPHGRWVCSPADVEACFVTGLAPERASMWQDWITLTNTLQQVVGHVPAAWLSGSFLTDAAVPGDIDCVYVVDAEDIARASVVSDTNRILLDAMSKSRVKSLFGLNVDSFILSWDPTSGPQPTSDPDYYRFRGYWDDLWVRAKDPKSPRLDAIPRRGYVEVMLDGYR